MYVYVLCILCTAGRFEDQQLSLTSKKPLKSTLDEKILPSGGAMDTPRRPKCPLFDTFTVSGCGAAYILCPDLSSRSAPRLAFLRVEVEHQQIVSSSPSPSPSPGVAAAPTPRRKGPTLSGWLEMSTAACLECLPRAWYDRHLLNSRFYCVKVCSFVCVENVSCFHEHELHVCIYACICMYVFNVRRHFLLRNFVYVRMYSFT